MAELKLVELDPSRMRPLPRCEHCGTVKAWRAPARVRRADRLAGRRDPGRRCPRCDEIDELRWEDDTAGLWPRWRH